MSGRAALLAFALLTGGCGGGGSSSTAPTPSKPSEQDGAAQACAQAKRTIAGLPKPKDVDGDADFADQAADALEKVDSPAVKPLRDAELAVIEVRMPAFNRAARRLQRAGGECGEREAARVLVPVAYSFGLDDAILDHNRKSPRAPDAFVAGMRFDAARFGKLAERVRKLAVPPELRAEHDRFLALVERTARYFRRAAADPSAYVYSSSRRIAAQRNRALRQLNRKLTKMVRA